MGNNKKNTPEHELDGVTYTRISKAPNQRQIDWTQEFDGVPLYHIAALTYAETGSWAAAVVALKENYGVRTFPENMRAAVIRWLCPPDVNLDRERPNSPQLHAWFAEFLDIHGLSWKDWLAFCVKRLEIFK